MPRKPFKGGGSFELFNELQALGSRRDGMLWPRLSQPLGEILELRNESIKRHASLIPVEEFPVFIGIVSNNRG